MPLLRNAMLLLACLCSPFLLFVQSQPTKIKKSTSTPVELIRAKKDFKVELLYSVPRETQGSWVSMCVDPKGRLITSDQSGRLYRVTPPAIGGKAEQTKVEKLPVDLGEAQGLLWAFDSLYVVVNKNKNYASGLYRVRSSKNDDQLDSKELLRSINGNGEHGPHAVLPGPDGKSLYVLCGNHTKLMDLAGSYVPKVWGEDFIVPRLWDANGHAKGIMAPGGCIYKTDKDGKNWTLVSMGYRNQYDAAFNRDGELFTFDADMEWDMNTPWYRPTRVCHAVPGSEFGWRGGTGKMYEYLPDNLPPVVNVGPGSPTGICFGYGAKFPAKYQEALYLCDWSFGKLYACHMTPDGATYKGELEDFLVGSPLPLTDIVISPTDGAMYFTIGGRNTMSGLYRVTYVGKESTAVSKVSSKAQKYDVEIDRDKARAMGLQISDIYDVMQATQYQSASELERTVVATVDKKKIYLRDVATVKIVEDGYEKERASRKKLESYYGGKDPEAIVVAWPFLSSEDRFLRFSARTDLEFQDPKSWQDKALKETNPIALTHALIGLARVGDKSLQPKMLEALERVDWSKLTPTQKIDYLRAYQLTFIRMGHPSAEWNERVGKRIDAWYPSVGLPTMNREVNAELCKLISYLETPQGVTKTLSLLAKAPTQEEQIEYALSLRTVKKGWTAKQHEEYFNWFHKAYGYRGGNSFLGFLGNIRKDAIESLTDQERADLKTVLATAPKPTTPKFTSKPRDFVKKWTVDELLPVVEKGLTERNYDRGRNLFGEAKCFGCHRFNNEGGGFGPDLTIVSGRYGPRDLLESIIEPSKVISDQYASVLITTLAGKSLHGRIINLHNDTIHVNTDMLNPNAITNVNRKDVDEITTSKISMMPDGLIDNFNADEVLDLVAYLYSRGDRQHKMFRKGGD
jgi:putative heme-binding domain-containing protein